MRSLFRSLLCLLCLLCLLPAAGASSPGVKMKHPNHLVNARSPYLLQHATNPVDWYPWGEEAFALAEKLDRPIFLSIGYATCHWCHVMAHESFEDPEVAGLLNDYFVSIKVDREERPDIDQVYMRVCQMVTGSGGWPLSIVMTPEKKPFFAATYIPKESRYGRMGMLDLLPKIADAWENRRSTLETSAGEISRNLLQYSGWAPGELRGDLAQKVYAEMASRFDPVNGGFGSAPKFPSPHNLLFLLNYGERHQQQHAIQMVASTLKSMHRGGIFDQIGFGFHRYSTDAKWLVPHFEKMLYDQAMMIFAAAEAFSLTGDLEFRQMVEEIAVYLDRDMSSPEGAFFSAEDADSEGEEGRFYLWTEKELSSVLSKEDFKLATQLWSTSASGNFIAEAAEHNTPDNILHLEKSPEEIAAELKISPEELERRREKIRRSLLEIRSHRPRPLLDDKVLTDTNALGIAALARAGALLGDEKLVERAAKAEAFLQKHLRDPKGALLHRYRGGHAEIPAFLDDVVFLSWAELELYRATLEAPYLQRSVELMHRAIRDFRDEKTGAFFFSSTHAEPLLIRSIEAHDGALPSGNSVAAQQLVALAELTADADFEQQAQSLFRAFGAQLNRAPSSMSWLIDAREKAASDSIEIVLVGSKEEKTTRQFLKIIREQAPSQTSLLLIPPGEEAGIIHHIAEFTANYQQIENKATAYLCRNGSCRLPTNDPDTLSKQIKAHQASGQPEGKR